MGRADTALTIGWARNDDHFVTLMSKALAAPASTRIVAGGMNQAQGVNNRMPFGGCEVFSSDSRTS